MHQGVTILCMRSALKKDNVKKYCLIMECSSVSSCCLIYGQFMEQLIS